MDKHRFDNIQIPNTFTQVWIYISQSLTKFIDTLYPVTIYAAVFYFGLEFTPLMQSPLLHLVGGAFSFALNILTWIITFCSGFITGFFEANKQSITMFPFSQGNLRVVIGGVFVIATFIRIARILANKDGVSGFDVLKHLIIGLGVLFGVKYLNDYQNLELSSAEEVFISIGYFVFYIFQSGKVFKPQQQSSEQE